LEVLDEIEEKMPEEVKKKIEEKKAEITDKRREKLEKLPDKEKERFKTYLDQISGDKQRHLEAISDLESEEISDKLSEVLEKAKEKKVEGIEKEVISADKANINLNFKLAAAIDLAGRDVFMAVHDSVNPKVIDSPAVSAVAKDGIQLIVKSRITLKADILKLVGGAGEETILAMVLENPDSISKQVLARGLDSNTAYTLLSIDIADIDVGDNIGAKLMADQAEADLQVARAKAEERRAMAVALEQEYIAKIQEMKAKLIEAEAQIPLAIAEALKSGNIGYFDYLKMKNIQADTKMRESLVDNSQKENQ